MVGDEFDCTVLGNHNGKAFRVLAAKAIGRTVPGSGILHGLKHTMLGLDIQCAINHFVFKTGNLDFNAKSKDGEFVIEQKATVDGREVRKPQSKLHKSLTKRVGELFVPLQVFLPTCGRFSFSERKLTQAPCDFRQE